MFVYVFVLRTELQNGPTFYLKMEVCIWDEGNHWRMTAFIEAGNYTFALWMPSYGPGHSTECKGIDCLQKWAARGSFQLPLNPGFSGKWNAGSWNNFILQSYVFQPDGTDSLSLLEQFLCSFYGVLSVCAWQAQSIMSNGGQCGWWKIQPSIGIRTGLCGHRPAVTSKQQAMDVDSSSHLLH